MPRKDTRLDDDQRERLYPRNLEGRLPDYNFPRIRFCSKGHAILGANILIKRDCVICRQCQKERHRKTVNSGIVSAERLQRIRFTVENGGCLQTLNGRLGDRHVAKRIITPKRFRNWARLHPKEGRQLLRLAIENGKRRRVEATMRQIVASPAIIRRMPDILDTIRAAVSRFVARDHRDDAISDIYTAVLERRLAESDIPGKAKLFVNARYRMDHDRYAPASLDMPKYRDDPTAAVNFIAADAPMWERLA